MQRRSKRLRTSTSGDGSVDSDIASFATRPNDATTKKSSDANQTNNIKRRVRGIRGKLESIISLPLDVLFEIFVELDPIDLLHLSRTSKSLRNILMSRSSIYVWKRVRAHIVGLPNCPPEMSEPAYANFIFHHYCQSCLKSTKTVQFNMRTRICNQCFDDHFERVSLDENILFGILPIIHSSNRQNRGMYFHSNTLRQLRAEMAGLEGAALQDWLAVKRSEYDAKYEFAEQCEEWIDMRSLVRANELEKIREERYHAIKGRLSQLGWKEEIDHLEKETGNLKDILSGHRLVKQSKPLTDRIWSNIRDTMIEVITDYKTRRLARLYRLTIRKRGLVLSKVIEGYAASQPLHAVFPPLADVANLPEFKTIIQDTPVEEKVTKNHFKAAFKDFPRIVSEWRQAKDEHLLDLIKTAEGPNEEVTKATLEYPWTFFRCERCTDFIAYPRVLVHRCTFAPHFSDFNRDDLSYFVNLGCKPWNHENRIVRYDLVASLKGRIILEDLHQLIPLTTNIFEKMQLRFECHRCFSEEGRLIMSWDKAIHHAMHYHREPETTFDWMTPALLTTTVEVRLSDMLEYIAKSPLSLSTFRSYEKQSNWICRECKRRVPWTQSIEHQKEKHPDIIPDDFTDDDHEWYPDRFMTLHLDAPLLLQVKINGGSPANSIRDALISNNYCSLAYEDFEEVTLMSQQLATLVDPSVSLLGEETEE